MSENKLSMPSSGIGGLMRYDTEYQSRFMIQPVHVVVFLVALLVVIIGLRVLFPVGA